MLGNNQSANLEAALSKRTRQYLGLFVAIIMLFMDPLYLCILCSFFGGGDMNGISLIIPEIAARVIYGILFVVNAVIFIKVVLPKYKMAFQ